MPKIPTYQSGDVSPFTNLPSGDASPRAFGGGSGLADLASGLNDVGNALYDVEQRQEVSDVTTNLAKLRGQATADLDTRAAAMAPGDPEFTSKFMQDFGNKLADMGGSIKTRAGMQAFQRGSAELTSGFLDSATKYQIHSAGVKATTDFLATENANIGTLIRDPFQFDSILKETDAALNDPDGMFAKMPADKRAELGLQSKEKYAFGAAQGIIRLNPQTALDMAKDGTLPGQQFLKDQSLETIMAGAERGVRGQEVKAAQLAAAHEKAVKDQAEKEGQDILKSLKKNPNDPKITDAILSSSLTWEKQDQLLDIADREAKKARGGDDKDDKTYGTGFVRLYEQVHQGLIKNPDDLYAHVGKDLTVAGVDKLTTEIMGRRTPDGLIESQLTSGFVAAAKKAISGDNPLFGFRDPEGEKLNQQALAWFLTEFPKQKEAGVPVHDLLDPANPKSLWSGMMRFKRPETEIFQALKDSVGNIGAPAEKPPAGATKTATGAKGQKIFLVGDKWVDAAGKETK